MSLFSECKLPKHTAVVCIGLLLYSIFILLFSYIVSVDNSKANNVYYSFISCLSLLLIFISAKYSGVKYGSVFYFFLVSISVFVFGKYLYFVLDYFFAFNDFSSEYLYTLNWMTFYSPSIEQERIVFIVTNFFIVFFSIGYFSFYNKSFHENTVIFNGTKEFIIVAKIFLMLTAPVYFYSIFNKILVAFYSGYLSLYTAQISGDQDTSILKLVFFVSLAVLIVLESKYKKYIILLVVVSLVSGLAGSRGSLVTMILAVSYMIFRKEKMRISLLVSFLFIVAIFFVMVLVFMFSARSDNTTENPLDFIYFLYSQGNTLSIISYSISADLKYEWYTMAQSFIPGMFKIYRVFNSDVNHYMGSITSFISYTANPLMYLSGNGLGSSIISEFYILSLKNIFSFSFLSFSFGAVFVKVERLSYINFKWLVYVFSIFPIVMFSPRSSASSVFVSSFYIFLIIIMFVFLSLVFKKIKR